MMRMNRLNKILWSLIFSKASLSNKICYHSKLNSVPKVTSHQRKTITILPLSKLINPLANQLKTKNFINHTNNKTALPITTISN